MGGLSLTACPSTPQAPSFQHAVLPVLIQHCATAEGCHGNKPTDSVDLDLRPPAAWSQLVGHPAEARKGALRVKPHDARASFLIAKLSGQLEPDEGKAMPIDEDTGVPLNPSPLPADYVEKVLTPWIAAGAPNN